MAMKVSPDLSDPRRVLTLVVSLAMLAGALFAWWYGAGNNSAFASAAMGRVGIVLFALFFAWPSLKRPAQWLPAGVAMICVVALIVIAAQPKLVFAAIPAAGLLIAVSSVVRAFRGRDR